MYIETQNKITLKNQNEIKIQKNLNKRLEDLQLSILMTEIIKFSKNTKENNIIQIMNLEAKFLKINQKIQEY